MQIKFCDEFNKYTHVVKDADRFYSAKKWKKVQEAYSYLSQVNPYNGKFWARLGEAQCHLRDYNASIEAFKRQAKTGFELGNCILNIARSYSALNQPKQAMTWLEKLIPLKNWNKLYNTAQKKNSGFDNIKNYPAFAKLMPPKPNPNMSHVDGWRTDLKFLAQHLAADHYNPYAKLSKNELDAAIKSLHNRIPKLSYQQVIIEMMRIVASVGDGHTRLYPPDSGKFRFHAIPVMFYEFIEGLYIRAAPIEYKDAVGKRVLKIGNSTVNEARERIKKVVSADNEMTYKWSGPAYLTITEFLYDMGMTDNLGKIDLLLQNQKGRKSAFTFKAKPLNFKRIEAKVEDKEWVSMHNGASKPAPLWLKDAGSSYWFEYLESQRLVYFQFNRIKDKSTESIASFCKRLFVFIRSEEVEALVIDLRLNDGGDSFLNQALINEIIKCEEINRHGRLFTIIGRGTFSACQNLTTDLERETETIFVGEPTASKPNFIGAGNSFMLPYSGLIVTISNRYNQHSLISDDYRNWIAPDIVAELSIEEFRSNIDPALDAVLRYLSRDISFSESKEQ